jgi:predicted GNAT family N-acyltransferase
MLARTIKDYIRKDIHKMSNAPGIYAGWVTDKADLSDIYKLRYNVMVRDVKQNPFPPNHYCIHGDEFRDAYDELPSTSHYLVRKNGKAVAAHRLINGNETAFEVEKYKWFDPRVNLWNSHTNVNNIVEPTRVVACRTIRGQYYTTMMLTASLLKIHDDKYESLLGVVNADAKPLMKHYQKFMPSLCWISREKFAVPEFVAGRHSHAFNMYIGTTNRERDAFIYKTILPCMSLCNYLYFTNGNKKN